MKEKIKKGWQSLIQNKRNLLIVGLSIGIILLLVLLFFLFFIPKESSKSNQFVVKFDTLGGSKIESIQVKKGETISFPKDPTKEGYLFNGWTFNGRMFDKKEVITKDITLVAHWISLNKPLYTVQFETNGGSKVEPIKVTEGEELIFPTPPTMKDYTFDGWYNKEGRKIEKLTVTNHTTLYARWKYAKKNADLVTEINNIMDQGDYSQEAKDTILKLLPEYQKLFNDQTIITWFSNIKSIKIFIHEANEGQSDSFNGAGRIELHIYKDENGEYLKDYRWLITHEAMHSLGDFGSNFDTTGYAGYGANRYTMNNLLEEALADSVADFVTSGTFSHDVRFAIKRQEEFQMFGMNGDDVAEYYNNHTYVLANNILNLFKYVGCFDALLEDNITIYGRNTQACFIKNVSNGESYLKRLLELLDLIYLYNQYPNAFYTKAEVQQIVQETPLATVDILADHNLNDFLIDYSKLAAEIINHKKNQKYSVCDFKKVADIPYSEDGVNFKSDLNC